MYQLMLALLFFVVALGYIQKDAQQAERQTIAGESAALSGNIAVYRNYVTTYAVANPAVTGTVADSSLSLPSWYVKTSGIGNYVAAGKGYVYFLNPPHDTLKRLLAMSKNSILVGVKQSGYLANPLSGPTSIPIPAAIPDGALVYVSG